ncbi:MAG TPA: hypothetical protein VE755_03420 [Myxococcales bacterium]|jgi:hypothetical protein|nr:hypothetical protein [Myxococcales bacterium]
MKRTLLVLSGIILVAGFAWVRGCSGPRPQLVSSRMRGPVAEAVIRNAGWGEGVIQVDFRVRPRGGGAPLLRSEKAALRPRETARVEVRIDGARGDEQLDVELDYPPR